MHFGIFEMHLFFIGGKMVKYALRVDTQVDCFSDGEMVVYDQINEVIHVMNITAALILNLIIDGEEELFDVFVNKILKDCPNVSIEKLEEDFQNIINDFLESQIIVIK